MKSENATSTVPTVTEEKQQPNSTGGNHGQIKLKDITPANIKNFIQGWGNKLMNDNLRVLALHKQEQAVYRSMLCGECLENRKCLVCGCGTPHMFYSPSKVDSKGRWGAMMEEQDWNKFKQENNLVFPEEIYTYFDSKQTKNNG